MRRIASFLALLISGLPLRAEVVPVEGQPLGANVQRLIAALEYLGAPLPGPLGEELAKAAEARDSERLQVLLDPSVLLEVSINPEERVKVARGAAPALLQQGGYTSVLVKVANASTATKPLRLTSPQAGAVYGGTAQLSMQRQAQMELLSDKGSRGRFLALEMFTARPMTGQLSGLEVEYAIALIYSSEAGKREATLAFDIGQGTQDLGFRAELPVLFDVRPASLVTVRVTDESGESSMARLQFEDSTGRVYPPQAKRLAPDLFFQKHIYRADGETVLLAPGKFTMTSSRGPEYRVEKREIEIAGRFGETLHVQLKRWIDAGEFGFFSGDHHIHGAGCAHYTDPTLGVTPADMFRQVKGEGLNVGCVLTWGPCFEHQREFFSPGIDKQSDGETLLKYDLEISGFGSQALGHVCLLNLKDQTYPGSDGGKDKGWPTWTTPVMRWAKAQGGVTGYAHSASGLQIDPASATRWLLQRSDRDADGQLDAAEAEGAFLPLRIEEVDRDRDGVLTKAELLAAHRTAADQLPNFAVPEMNGVGAMEICVAACEGVCDFISAMDTRRIQEWNTWYHLLNCGFPIAVSGETDFPCMSGRRVGAGRVYVQLGRDAELDFDAWCDGLRRGRSYVCDGYAHALEFTVDGVAPGFGEVELAAAGRVKVRAKVTFAPETPETVAQGLVVPAAGRQLLGDTVNLNAPRSEALRGGGEREIEIVVNGLPVARRSVLADGGVHVQEFEIPVDRSSWVALRQFPQLHTNPVVVRVGGAPVRASRRSARWCIEMTERLWENRKLSIAEPERAEAEAVFGRALDKLRAIMAASPTD